VLRVLKLIKAVALCALRMTRRKEPLVLAECVVSAGAEESSDERRACWAAVVGGADEEVGAVEEESWRRLRRFSRGAFGAGNTGDGMATAGAAPEEADFCSSDRIDDPLLAVAVEAAGSGEAAEGRAEAAAGSF
jgi:hypothetical protein